MGDTEFKGQKMMSDIEFERQKIIIQHEYNIEKLKFESDEKRKDIRLHNLHEQNKSAENYSKEYGVIFTRSMILLNGGAIILSINSFINLSTKNTSLTISLFIDAFLCYLIGIICALIISIMGYFNFGYISQAY